MQRANGGPFGDRVVTLVIRRTCRAMALVLLVALLVPALSTAIVHAAGNIQYVGTTADDAGTGTNCTQPLLACTLRDALNAAASGDTISLPPGNVNLFDILLTNGPLTIAKSVTIQGGGLLTVDGSHASRVFEVDAGTVGMNGVTITHGQASDHGAGLFVSAGSVTLTNCVVTGNTLSGTGRIAGGGIYETGDLTLTNTTVSGNIVTDSGTTTADSALGGGIGQDGGTLTVTGSTISGNAAQMTAPNANTEMGGGGIFINATMHITSSTVSGNRTIGAIGLDVGGGMLIFGTTTVTNSTIATNSVGNEGGGIFTQGALTLTESTVTGNTAPFAGGVVNSGSATLVGALIARNSDNSGIPDAVGAVASASSNNLIGNGTGMSGISNGSQGNQVGTGVSPINPQLDPNGLQPNGSGPLTVALRPNSPAIEAGGACPGGVTTDERGQPRVGACDIGAYEYQPVTPTVSGTAMAPVNGGSVTFHGTGFQTGSQLTIGSTTINAPASGVSDDGTAMTLTIPAHSAGTVAFAVANPGSGHVAAATLAYQPVVTSLSATSGAAMGGSPVMITGVGFVAGNTSVMFGNAPATVTNVTPTTISVTVPAHAVGTVDVTVTVNGVSGTKTGAYAYGTVNPIVPPRPPTGTPITGNPGAAPSPRASVGVQTGATPKPLPPSR